MLNIVESFHDIEPQQPNDNWTMNIMWDK